MDAGLLEKMCKRKIGMENLKLSRAYLRPETEPGYEKEAWRPMWKCFCCQDSGLVKEHLVKTVIDGYDSTTDKLVRCNATDCEGRKKYDGDDIVLTGTLDNRFPSQLCDRFDEQERQTWKQWCQEKHELRKQRLAAIDTNCTRNLRRRSRSNQERAEAQRRHRDISAN